MADALTMNETKKRAYRIWELDFIRGLCVLLMVFDHIMQLMYFTNNDKMWDMFDAYIESSIQNFFHPIIRAIFFLICGISCCLSRSNIKRGSRLFGVACTITFVTLFLSTTGEYFYGVTIYFGVLHMLALSILYYAILGGLSDCIPHIGGYIPALIGIFCIIFYHSFIKGRAGDYTLGYFPAVVGYDIQALLTADYSPLFPEMGFVLIGTGLGQFYKSRYRYVLAPLDGRWNKPVCFFGRNALVIYIGLPIIVGAVYSFL